MTSAIGIRSQNPSRGRLLAGLAAMSLLVVFLTALAIALALASTFASGWIQPIRQPAEQTLADVGLTYEDAQLVTDDGLTLAAWYVPSRNGAAIVMLHGIHGNRGQLLELARRFAGAGYGSLSLDLRAHGESDGSLSSLGLFEVRDVRAAVTYLKQRPEVDPERIGIYGISLGAAVAIMAAAEIPELKAVVADSAFASVDGVARDYLGRAHGVPDFFWSLIVLVGGLQIAVNPADIAPVEVIDRIAPRPILIIHGEEDELFHVSNAVRLADAAGEPKQLWIGPEHGHTSMIGADLDGYMARVLALFAAL